MNAVIRPILWGSPEYEQELALRQRIMRAPLGLDLYAENLNAERQLFHFGAFREEALEGVIVLAPINEKTARVHGICVEELLQRSGVGRQLMRHAEAFLPTRGCSILTLHARVTARGFYEKLGYHLADPEEFTEVGIPHVAMEKQLIK